MPKIVISWAVVHTLPLDESKCWVMSYDAKKGGGRPPKDSEITIPTDQLENMS